MAITGRFLADFSDFEAAVQKATTSLKFFQTTSESAGQSLTRATEGFSGRKIIQEAHTAVEAVQRLGGVAALTREEQDRLNAVVTQAIAKYEALGKVVGYVSEEATAELRKFAEATKRVEDNVVSAEAKTSKWKDQLGGLKSQLAAAFSVAAVVNFGREILQLGDDIQKTADRTGLTTEEVQRLGYVASQSGNSIDEITSAVSQMQNRLAEGDKSAVGALQRLNLSFDDLKSRDPYQQLQLIAHAVGQIPNPANQAQVAMDLFGRTGAAILPTLKSDFDNLAAAAPLMADSTVRSLDAAGDAIDDFKLRTKVLGAGIIELFSHVGDGIVIGIYPALAKLEDGVKKAYEAILKIPGAETVFPHLKGAIEETAKSAQWYRDAVGAQIHQLDLLATQSERTHKPVSALNVVTKDAVKAHTDAAKAHTAHAAATRETKRAADEAIPSLRIVTGEVGNIGEQFAVDIPVIKDWTIAVKDGLQTAVGLKTELVMPTAPGGKAGGFFAGLLGDPKDFGSGIAEAIQGAFQGGGNVLNSAFSFAGRHIGESIAGNLAKTGGRFFQNALGQVFTGAIPVIGSLIGPLASSIWNKLFGTAGRDKVKEFAASFGGFDALHDKLLQLGADGEQLWINLTQGVGRNNPEQAAAAIQAINDAFDQGIPTVSDLKEIAERYGGTLDDLGPKAQQMEITETANSIVEDFKRMQQAGVDMGGMYRISKEEVAKLLAEAKKTGAALPITLKPYLEAMMEAGDLTDEAGNKIEDLSGFNFSEDLVTSIGELVDTMKDFVGVVTGKGGAIDALHKLGDVELKPKHLKIIQDMPDQGPPMRMASGGNFLVTKPTLFLAGEAGPERASFSGAGRTSVADEGYMPVSVQIEDEVLIRTIVKVAKKYGVSR